MMSDQEKAERRAKLQIMDAMIDGLIAVEKDPTMRGTMVILRTCGKIQDWTNLVADRVTTKAMLGADKQEIQQLEEYLTLVLG